MKLKPLIKFVPLLVLYVVIVLIFSKDFLQGDEGRYLGYASNLLNGFYSPHGVDINLWNGPGYPIVLVPFLAFHIPLIFAKLLNAVFLFFAVIYFYFTLSLFLRSRISTIFAYLLGMYVPLFLSIPLLITEVFAVFLVCGFMFHFCQWSRGLNKKDNCLASALYFGYLALTKVFFGPVIITGLLICLLLSLFGLRRVFVSSLPIYLLAFIVCIPYLIYTYALTGKPVYWSNSGGESLYWMSTLNSEEFGDWHPSQWSLTQPQFASHKDFLSNLTGLSLLRQDEELRKQAIVNIRSNPKKYIKNLAANMGRMLFSYPYSYTSQKLSTFFYILPNMFFVVLLILGFYPYFSRLSKVPSEVHNLLLFGIITFLGSAVLSAYPRQLFPVVPIMLLFIAFVGTRILKIEMHD